MLFERDYPLYVIWKRLSSMRYLEEIIPYTLSGREYPLYVIWKRLSSIRYLGQIITYTLSGSESFHEFACFCLNDILIETWTTIFMPTFIYLTEHALMSLNWKYNNIHIIVNDFCTDRWHLVLPWSLPIWQDIWHVCITHVQHIHVLVNNTIVTTIKVLV